ncbi:ABC transporter permease [candidate division KSB1 bacterium]
MKPPRLLKFLLRIFAENNRHDSYLGDIEEVFNEIRESKGIIFARLWYSLHVIRVLPIFLYKSIYWSFIMFKNYLKIAIRNIKRNKGFSFINITGLAVGIACFVLILIWVQHELSFDGFHVNKDRTFRLLQHIKYNEIVTWAITQGPVAPGLKKDFPEIEDFTRISYTTRRFIINNEAYQSRGMFVDPGFFKIFSIKLLEGNPETVFKNPHSVVVTQDFARTLFGNEDPLGKVVNVNKTTDVTVTGIIENPPDNTHLRFNYLLTMEYALEAGRTVNIWTNSHFVTYLLLKKNVIGEDFEKKIYNFLDDKPTLEEWEKLSLQPLTKIHLSSGIGFNNSGGGSVQYIIIFSAAALFILILACINFINLTTARSTLRAKEIGLRKVAGAKRNQIIRQFLGESVVLSVIALLFAVLICLLVLPVFNHLSGKNFSKEIFFSKGLILQMLLITGFAGLAAGGYPALLISAFKPASVVRGLKQSGVGNMIFRKVLVVFQFVVSVVLLIGTLVVFAQINYMQNKDTGFNKENLMYIRLSNSNISKHEEYKNELKRYPGIIEITAANSFPTYGISFSNSLWNWEGKTEKTDVLFTTNIVDYDYFKTFGIDILEGREFSRNFASDSAALVINEKAMNLMGFNNPVGKKITYGRTGDTQTDYRIIGVVRDFNFLSLHSEIGPQVIVLAPEYDRYIFARISGENTTETIGFMENKWKEFGFDYSFDYGFIDESFQSLYTGEKQIGDLLKYFTVLAVIISCLGLFGLASFMTVQRTKEIGIRKVLGANISSILLLFTKEFNKCVLTANIVAWPLAYYFMYKWLGNFAYRTDLKLWIFFAAGFVSILISILTVSYQAVRSARSNPVDSLKHE